MGKSQNSSLKVGRWSIYPKIISNKPDKEGNCGVIIRITDRTKNVDVEVYDGLGQRIKCKPSAFANGKINSGFEQDIINTYNRIIESMKVRLAEYASRKSHFNKDLLLNHIYPTQFLNTHKKKRTKYITIPVHSKTGEVVSSYEIEKKEVQELLSNVDLSNDPETGEPAIQDDEDFFHIVASEKLTKDQREKKLKHLAEVELMSPLERYQKGEFNKGNIFDVAGQVLFLNKNEKAKKPFSNNWKMAVMKLFEYRSRFQPLENVKDLSTQWVIDLITTIKEKGYSKAHPKKFNPFSYKADPFKNSGIAYYNDLSLEKFIKNLKEVFRWLGDEGKLPKIDIDKIKYEDFNLARVTQHTKKDYYLTKEEFDSLLSFKFKDCLYIKKTGKSIKNISYTKEQLGQARDLFILQTYLGGLRPNEMYDDNVSILSDGKGAKKVHYYISKDGKVENENPICSYSDIILKKYDYKFDKILIEYSTYCQMLKVIASQIFDRVIIKTEERDGQKKKLKLNIADEFESYFARKTFQMLLKEEANISSYDLKEFVGHKISDVQGHYITYTLKRKREIMESIKPK
jgi:integrase